MKNKNVYLKKLQVRKQSGKPTELSLFEDVEGLRRIDKTTVTPLNGIVQVYLLHLSVYNRMSFGGIYKFGLIST